MAQRPSRAAAQRAREAVSGFYNIARPTPGEEENQEEVPVSPLTPDTDQPSSPITNRVVVHPVEPDSPGGANLTGASPARASPAPGPSAPRVATPEARVTTPRVGQNSPRTPPASPAASVVPTPAVQEALPNEYLVAPGAEADHYETASEAADPDDLNLRLEDHTDVTMDNQGVPGSQQSVNLFDIEDVTDDQLRNALEEAEQPTAAGATADGFVRFPGEKLTDDDRAMQLAYLPDFKNTRMMNASRISIYQGETANGRAAYLVQISSLEEYFGTDYFAIDRHSGQLNAVLEDCAEPIELYATHRRFASDSLLSLLHQIRLTRPEQEEAVKPPAAAKLPRQRIAVTPTPPRSTTNSPSLSPNAARPMSQTLRVDLYHKRAKLVVDGLQYAADLRRKIQQANLPIITTGYRRESEKDKAHVTQEVQILDNRLRDDDEARERHGLPTLIRPTFFPTEEQWRAPKPSRLFALAQEEVEECEEAAQAPLAPSQDAQRFAFTPSQEKSPQSSTKPDDLQVTHSGALRLIDERNEKMSRNFSSTYNQPQFPTDVTIGNAAVRPGSLNLQSLTDVTFPSPVPTSSPANSGNQADTEAQTAHVTNEGNQQEPTSQFAPNATANGSTANQTNEGGYPRYPTSSAGSGRPNTADVTPRTGSNYGRDSPRSNAQDNTCWKCGQTGHRRINCTAKVWCTYCQRPNHIEANCRTKQRDQGDDRDANSRQNPGWNTNPGAPGGSTTSDPPPYAPTAQPAGPAPAPRPAAPVPQSILPAQSPTHTAFSTSAESSVTAALQALAETQKALVTQMENTKSLFTSNSNYHDQALEKITQATTQRGDAEIFKCIEMYNGEDGSQCEVWLAAVENACLATKRNFYMELYKKAGNNVRCILAEIPSDSNPSIIKEEIMQTFSDTPSAADAIRLLRSLQQGPKEPIALYNAKYKRLAYRATGRTAEMQDDTSRFLEYAASLQHWVRRKLNRNLANEQFKPKTLAECCEQAKKIVLDNRFNNNMDRDFKHKTQVLEVSEGGDADGSLEINEVTSGQRTNTNGRPSSDGKQQQNGHVYQQKPGFQGKPNWQRQDGNKGGWSQNRSGWNTGQNSYNSYRNNDNTNSNPTGMMEYTMKTPVSLDQMQRILKKSTQRFQSRKGFQQNQPNSSDNSPKPGNNGNSTRPFTRSRAKLNVNEVMEDPMTQSFLDCNAVEAEDISAIIEEINQEETAPDGNPSE